jgi:16S rRNA (cytosine967-C5)-methyltransferase
MIFVISRLQFAKKDYNVKLYRNLTYAVVDGLEAIIGEKRYADKVIEKLLKRDPRWGARDRRFIAETIYDIIRWYRLFCFAASRDYWHLLACWLVKNKIDLPDWQEFKGLASEKINEKFKEADKKRTLAQSIPDWLDELAYGQLGERWEKELIALNAPAPVILRANTLKISQAELISALKDEHISCTAQSGLPDALMLDKRVSIFSTSAFKSGLFEVQDAGSQTIAPFLKPEPGLRIVDACAGAGGKTLHLAALMENSGRLIALDTEQWKLDELKKRARRAGATNIEIRCIENMKVIKRLENTADRLLLDVPCSGLGVLRRNPDAKWKLTQEFIDRVVSVQKDILEYYHKILRPGGIMVYATCSILPSENEEQVKTFLTNHPEFSLAGEQQLWPSGGTDGFYMARMIKRKD